jgi:AcrR family transcriptional regulator
MKQTPQENTTPVKNDDLIRGARTVFTEYGYRKTTIDDIARSVGMTRTALYYYYRNKEDIFLAVLEYELEEHHTSIIAKIGTGRSLNENIKTYCADLTAMREKFFNVYQLSSSDWAENPRISESANKMILKYRTSILTQIIMSADTGLPEKHIFDAALILSKSLRGLITQCARPKRSELEREMTVLIGSFITGMVHTYQRGEK